jgi:hypothetical protein
MVGEPKLSGSPAGGATMEEDDFYWQGINALPLDEVSKFYSEFQLLDPETDDHRQLLSFLGWKIFPRPIYVGIGLLGESKPELTALNAYIEEGVFCLYRESVLVCMRRRIFPNQASRNLSPQSYWHSLSPDQPGSPYFETLYDLQGWPVESKFAFEHTPDAHLEDDIRTIQAMIDEAFLNNPLYGWKRSKGRPSGSGYFKSSEDFIDALKDVLSSFKERPTEIQVLQGLRRHCRKPTLEWTASNTSLLRQWLSKVDGGMTFDQALDAFWRPQQ